MLYTITKIFVRLALLIFCRKIVFSSKAVLDSKGPLLLACNHPNSFFDAVLLGAYFKRPVHFLARGDAFKNPLAQKVLTALKAIPIYRLREGKKYLALNDYTFEQCTHILNEGGIVLIFSEGLCLNQYQLRPLKKGTARIALNSWNNHVHHQPLKILPVSFNYSTFNNFNKDVLVHFGKPITQDDLVSGKNEAVQMLELTNIIYERLAEGMLLEDGDRNSIQFLLSRLRHNIPVLKQQQQSLKAPHMNEAFLKMLDDKDAALTRSECCVNLMGAVILLLPATVGFLIHLPIYFPIKNLLKNKTAGTVFYHSAMFASLLVLYPIYCTCLGLTVYFIFNSTFAILAFITLPVLAIICLQFKTCVTRIYNYSVLIKSDRKKIRQIVN